jgi:photosystem II stability/assembly factor-like uncharacterized protein
MSASSRKTNTKLAKKRQPWWLLVAGLGLIALGAVWYVVQTRGGNATTLGQVSGDLHALMFAPAGQIFYGQHGGLQISSDDGRSWTRPSGTGDAMAIASSPKQPEVIYQAGHDLFLKSSDGGKTWTEPGFGNLPGTDIHGFAIAPESGWLYANIAGQGLYRTTGNDTAWEFVTSATAGAMTLAAGPGTPAVLYALTMDQGLIRSTDGGNDWQIAARVPGTSMSGVYGHPKSGNLYLAGEEGIYLSSDQGESWSLLKTGESMALVAADTADETKLVAISQQGQTYRSDDGGKTWLK